MPLTHSEAQRLIQTARNRDAGKPIANNTRLYGEPGGDFRIIFHGTTIVTIHTDGTYTLANGGYNTVTTLARIRGYAPVYQSLDTERGEWYVRMKPVDRDPQPKPVERTIPKPFTAIDPGAEPIKSDEGCVAGRLITTRHINEAVECYRREMQPGDRLLEVIRPESFDHGGGYDRVRVARSWNSHTYYTDGQYYSEGWGKLVGNLNTHNSSFVNADGEIVKRVQCPHCRRFDARHLWWNERYHGHSWGHIDKRGGFKLYLEMMGRFHNDKELWQEAYLKDFRARRAYTQAEREWQQRNRVPFYDGIKVDSEGWAERVRQTGPSPAKLRRHERDVERLKKRIEKYINNYIKALTKEMPLPSNSDCWFCALRTNTDAAGNHVEVGTGVTWGDMGDNSHLFTHLEDRYYVPTLAVNALREAKYSDAGVFLYLHMKPESHKMGGPDIAPKPYDTVKRALRKYMYKRMIPQAPTS
jgi:hypothetical protein